MILELLKHTQGTKFMVGFLSVFQLSFFHHYFSHVVERPVVG